MVCGSAGAHTHTKQANDDGRRFNLRRSHQATTHTFLRSALLTLSDGASLDGGPLRVCAVDEVCCFRSQASLRPIEKGRAFRRMSFLSYIVGCWSRQQTAKGVRNERGTTPKLNRVGYDFRIHRALVRPSLILGNYSACAKSETVLSLSSLNGSSRPQTLLFVCAVAWCD